MASGSGMRRAVRVIGLVMLGVVAGWVLRGEKKPPREPPGTMPLAVRIDRPAERKPDGEWVFEVKELQVIWTADGDVGPVDHTDAGHPPDGAAWRITLTMPRERKTVLVCGENLRPADAN